MPRLLKAGLGAPRVAFGEPLQAPGPNQDPEPLVDELRRRTELLRKEALALAGRP